MTQDQLCDKITKLRALKTSNAPIIDVLREERDFYIEFIKDVKLIGGQIGKKAKYILRML